MKEDLTHEELAEQFRLLAEAANDTGDEETVGPVRAPVYVAPSVNEFDADFEAGLDVYDADADDAFETEFGGAFESFGPEPDADDEAVAEESETIEIIPSPAMAPMFEAIEAAAEETRVADAEAARDRAAGPGFWGFVWAFAWTAVSFGVPTAMIGADALQNQNPALYVAMAAAAIAPALLILSTFSAARESRRTREETRRIAALAEKALAPAEDAQDQARTLGRTVREEIGALQVVVGTALDRFAELEAAAQRNALVFDEAVTSARTGAGALTETLQNERLAFEALTSELHAQTETIGENVSRQIRMMRETSRIVRQEYAAADEALTNHFNAFAASADVMAERTQAIELAAAATKAASVQLDETVMTALEALTQATSITDAARQSADAAAQVAQATAGAVRDTTRRAVADARRVAQLIRNETTAMEESAATTLSRLKDAADEARRASEEAQAAADRHAEGIQRRLSAMAAQAAQPVAAQPALQAPPVAPPAPVEVISNDDVAEEKIRVGERFLRTAYAPSAPVTSSGFSRASEPTVDAPVKPASRFVAPPVEPKAPAPQPKSAAENVLALLTEVGVDAGAVFTTTDLDFIAHRARQGGASRRQAVAAAAPEAIDALKSYFGRSAAAYAYAKAFRAKPELATSNGGKKLLVAYLLVDAALG